MSATRRGELFAAWDAAARWPEVRRVYGADVPDGFAAWLVGPDDEEHLRQVVLLPALRPLVPRSVIERYHARILANATGRCPACGEVAGLTREPPAPGERGLAAWRTLPLHVELRHAADCPATFTEADRRWFVLTPEENDS